MEPYNPSSPGCLMFVFLLAFAGILGLMIVPVQSNIETGSSAEPAESVEMISSDANADVTYVRAVQTGAETWTFYVTVAHPDTGWDDYADGWDVVLPDGTVIKPNPDDPFTRLLLHPHENEQPFTRSQSGIVISPDVAQVTVRAHDIVDGWGGQTVTVDLAAESGDSFEVERP